MSGREPPYSSSAERQLERKAAEDSGRNGITRRGFLKGAGLTAAGTALLEGVQAFHSEALAVENAQAIETGPGPVPVTLHVNGKEHMIEVEPRSTLADVLRVQMGMTGTKVSCDRGSCSACTVWLNGMAVCSCMLLAIDVGARSVTTIEGLADGETLHPVQAAFIEHDALQCGFCTSGMIMSCAALLEQTPDPTIEDIHTAISGHICRCGTYPHIVTATIAASKVRKA